MKKFDIAGKTLKTSFQRSYFLSIRCTTKYQFKKKILFCFRNECIMQIISLHLHPLQNLLLTVIRQILKYGIHCCLNYCNTDFVNVLVLGHMKEHYNHKSLQKYV